MNVKVTVLFKAMTLKCMPLTIPFRSDKLLFPPLEISQSASNLGSAVQFCHCNLPRVLDRNNSTTYSIVMHSNVGLRSLCLQVLLSVVYKSRRHTGMIKGYDVANVLFILVRNMLCFTWVLINHPKKKRIFDAHNCTAEKHVVQPCVNV